MNTLSFPILNGIIQRRLRKEGLHSHPFLHMEFICSNKKRIGHFEGDRRDELLQKLRHDKGVVVREITLSSRESEEKGVDMHVFVRMLEMGRINFDAVLMASDKDYVPAIDMLTRRGVHTVVVGFDDIAIELINESYLFIDMQELLEEMEEEVRKIQPDA